MVTSNKCRHGRSPNICVNIIQNPLGAISCGAKSYLGLLSDDVIFTNFNLQVLTSFNKPYFAKAFKDFSPVCPNLICQSWVQSLSEFVEVVTCPVTVSSIGYCVRRLSKPPSSL